MLVVAEGIFERTGLMGRVFGRCQYDSHYLERFLEVVLVWWCLFDRFRRFWLGISSVYLNIL